MGAFVIANLFIMAFAVLVVAILLLTDKNPKKRGSDQ